MNAPDGRVVRPTLRCLLEDLRDEVGPAELRSALATAQRDMAEDSRYLFPLPLAAAKHIVLDKANMLALDPAAEREPIRAITDRAMVKVKTSDRRGALWQDDEGTWWLVAAGRRQDDGSGDFYQAISRYAADSDSLVPTAVERTYHRFESAYIADCDADRDAQAKIIRVLLDAAADPGVGHTVDVFGAAVTIVVEPEEDGSDMLSMSFDFSTFEERGRFPIDVIGFVPGYESIDDWDILPPLRDGDPECWYTYASAPWVAWLAKAVELDQLVENPEVPRRPSVAASAEQAHLVPASVVTLAYVEGLEISALCGVRFLPHRDPEHFDECSACAEALLVLRRGAAERREGRED